MKSVVFLRSLLLAVLAVAYIGGAANAAVVLQTTADLIGNSSDIISAQVISTEGEWNDEHTFIFTRVDLKVSKQYKGTLEPESTITVMAPGGAVGEIGLKVEHAPQFEVGEEVILFLTPLEEGQFRVTAWEQGKFTIEEDKIKETGRDLSVFLDEIKAGLK